MSRLLNSATLACLLILVGLPAFGADSADTSPATAVRIVLDTQMDKIRSVDNPKDWWHDTKERSWSAKRPVEPGILDTTHTFTVIYRINEVAVAAWQVDTRAGTAVSLP